ncbi:hypothetical protein GCM10027062_35690 [Nocardioides hungaricus]
MNHRRLDKRSGAILMAICATVTVIAFSSAQAQGAGSTAMAPPSNVVVSPLTPPDPADAIPEELVAEAARVAGLADFNPSDYSGSWYDPETETIMLGATAEAMQQWAGTARRLAADEDIQIVEAEYSSTEGQEVLDRFFAESPLIEKAVMWGLAPDGNTFEIAIIGEPTDADLVELAKLPGEVRVQTGLTEMITTVDALEDTAPLAGGARYGTGYWSGPTGTVIGGRCTGGFPYTEGGTNFILTAGHCYKRTTIYDRMYRLVGPNSNYTPSTQFGTFNGRSTLGSGATGTVKTNGGDHGDLALVNTSSTGTGIGDMIWATYSDRRYVNSRQAPAMNDNVCRFGTTSGALCGLNIGTLNTTVNSDSGPFKQVDIAYLQGQSVCVSGGDSGGPVFRKDGANGAVAIGVISGTAPVPSYGCMLVFTGVEEAIQAWGGGPKLR